jgi:hypothetical protein
MAEQFRTESKFFTAIPWFTNILCVPGALGELVDVSEFSVCQSIEFRFLVLTLPGVEGFPGLRS